MHPAGEETENENREESTGPIFNGGGTKWPRAGSFWTRKEPERKRRGWGVRDSGQPAQQFLPHFLELLWRPKRSDDFFEAFGAEIAVGVDHVVPDARAGEKG